MCKTPAPNDREARMLNPAVEDGHVDSEYEDLPPEYGSSEMDTSSEDEEATDSDAESATGHRVTTDMAVWYMLKQEGLLTEEKYAAKKDMYVHNIKTVLPKLPRSELSDEEGSLDRSGSYDFNFVNSDNDSAVPKDGEDLFESMNNKNKGLAETSNVNDVGNHDDGKRVIEQTSEDVEKAAKVAKLDLAENNTNDPYNFVNPDNDNADPNGENVIQVMNQKNKGLAETSTENEVGNQDDDEKRVIEETSDDVAKAAKVAKLDLSENNTIDQSEEQANREAADVTMSECALGKTANEEMVLESQQSDNTNIEETSNIVNEKAAEVEVKDVEPAKTEDKTKLDFELMELVDTKKDSEKIGDKSNNIHQPRNKETKSFKYILKKLVKDNRISSKCDYLDILITFLKDLDKHYKKNKAVELFDTPTDELKQFAMTLNFYSPSSYKYITETFNTPLPDHKVLSSWYVTADDYRSGLMERAFNVLKKKAASKRFTCALMSRDIYLKNYGRDCDYTDYGGGCNDEYCEKAVIIFAFVLVSLDEDWKMPIGYVFARDMPADSQAALINVCLTQCHAAGVDVVAVTLETPTPAEFLGCSFEDPKNLKTTFKHPDCDREVAVWIDPCLALRSVRDLLNAKGSLQDGAGNTICWSLIKKLRHLYSDSTIDCSKPGFLELRNHLAKVGLTMETFSESLARALELCGELKPFVFNDTAPTQKYIEIINMVYDILHSKKVTNWGDVDHQLNEAKEYMLGIYCNEVNKLVVDDKHNLAADKRLVHRSFVEGKQACGLLVFLTCITSFENLHTTLVEKEQRIDRLNTHRLCKDQVEDFVKNIRAFNRIDIGKFNGWIFQSFCDRWFDDLEKNPRFSDQNMTLEQWPLKNKYSPAVTLNRTCGKRSFDEVYSCQHVPKKLPKTSHHEEALKVLGHFTNALDTATDVADRKYMVGYLAGWIAAKFAKSLKCEVCIDALCSDKKLWFHKFITSKDLNGVCLPSEEVFRICWECERTLRQKGSVAQLRVWVLRHLASKFPWSTHQAKHHRTHFMHLVRAVIAKYIPLRVAAPFSAKDKQKIISMFRMFSCISRLGVFEQLDASRQNGGDSTE